MIAIEGHRTRKWSWRRGGCRVGPLPHEFARRRKIQFYCGSVGTYKSIAPRTRAADFLER